MSTLFVGDDAFDSDEGYRGKLQYIFAMIGDGGHHATEMDSKSKVNGVKSVDSTPRSYPMVSHATFIGGGTCEHN